MGGKVLRNLLSRSVEVCLREGGRESAICGSDNHLIFSKCLILEIRRLMLIHRRKNYVFDFDLSSFNVEKEALNLK